MVCLRGESLTTHRNQMKLFETIAAAAVIGGSLIAASPANAHTYTNYVPNFNNPRFAYVNGAFTVARCM